MCGKMKQNMDKKKIVLLHGWGANTKKLEPLKKSLEDLGWNVLLPKLPGFNAPAPKEVWGVDDYADYVLRFTAKEFGGGEFFVFGHSFGGRVAIKLGVKGLPAGVILCAASGLSRGNPIKRAFFWTLAKVGKIFLVVPPVAAVWRKRLYKLGGEHDYEKTKGIMRDVFKRVVAEDFRPSVSRITVPTLILWGREDRMTPVRDAQFIKNVLPKSKLVVFAKEGHRLPYERPKQVAGEIDKWFKILQ